MNKYFLALLFSINTTFAYEVAVPKYSLDFLLNYALAKKNQNYNPKIQKPTYHFASTTPLVQFQDAIETQWGMRPDLITNAFAVNNNEVYILDEAAYYKKHNRCIDDSIVHELVHYVQVKYLNWDLHDESLEWDAVEIQSQFREEFCKTE